MTPIFNFLRRHRAPTQALPMPEMMEMIMATLADVQSSIATLGTNVQTLIAKVGTGSESADLDTLKSQVDTINGQVEAVINPPAPTDGQTIDPATGQPV